MRLLLLAFALTTAVSAQSLTSKWQGPTQAIVEVHDCGGNVCLKLVQLPPNAPGDLDMHNPDTTLRSRALCGLEIGTGFRQDDATHLSGGRLYDPKSGKTYKGTITLDGDTLKLRGYVGFSALGRTENWTRTTATPTCK